MTSSLFGTYSQQVLRYIIGSRLDGRQRQGVMDMPGNMTVAFNKLIMKTVFEQENIFCVIMCSKAAYGDGSPSNMSAWQVAAGVGCRSN